jgi:MoaA/NifB/PqqE/SkfB family radical SAM enzyme
MLTPTSTIEINRQALLEDCDRRELVVDHLPFYYAVHLNMPCNQRCIMCVPDFNHPRDVLPFERFVELYEQIKDFAEHITLIGGETFMYPWIEEALELLAGSPIAVTIHTNSFMLNDRVIPGLLRLHELDLKCSIDAATATTYRRIRGRNHFDQVTANMRHFSEVSRNRPEMHLITVFVVMRENLDEVLPFIDFAKTLHPHRVEFHPVRHVSSWQVQNGTGWHFDGSVQSCESFRDEYNEVMRLAARKCEQEGLAHEVLFV